MNFDWKGKVVAVAVQEQQVSLQTIHPVLVQELTRKVLQQQEPVRNQTNHLLLLLDYQIIHQASELLQIQQ